VSLDDQHGYIEEIKARTRDGIPIVIRDVHYRYRLRTGRRFGDHEQRRAINPYRFSVQAVKDMAYNRTVTTAGLSDWHTAVKLSVDGAISDFVKANKFDQLTAPATEEANPRLDVNNKILSSGTRNRLRTLGAELLWFDAGHFDVDEKIEDIELKEVVAEQRIDTWSARWDGYAMEIEAFGEAHRMSNHEIGRAEGQAELMKSIIQAFNDARSGDDSHKKRDLRALIWMQIAQILDTINDEGEQPSTQLPPKIR
jgi:hypothetical protein